MFSHGDTVMDEVNHQQVREQLLSLKKYHDNVVYQQFLVYLQMVLAQTKQQILTCQPEERDWRIGIARAYRDLLAELSQPEPLQ